MSSMLRASTALLALSILPFSAPALAQDAAQWDIAQRQNAARHDMAMHQAIDRWKRLTSSSQFSFGEYAGFLLSYPGFPQEEKLRRYAEAALDREAPDTRAMVSYFQKFPPLTNEAKARYAVSLAAQRASGARELAREAWRGGPMNETAEATLSYQYGDTFTRDDHDARMDALLWEGDLMGAQRQIARVSPEKRNLFMERLNIAQGNRPGSLGIPFSPDMMRDPGYVYQVARQARASGNLPGAISLLSTRPDFSRPVFDDEKWVKELLTAARGAGADPAVRIASKIDDAFPPGTDISDRSFRLRDDYTSLMWLGGTKALWSLGDARRAAPLFYRYGAAAKTPPTRSKGFYWAGRALAQAGDRDGAKRYFEMAAQYPDHFYGQLALERLGRAIPKLDETPSDRPSSSERARFDAQPLTRAAREVARDFDWRTTVTFFREIADQAKTEADYVMVADLAREIGRRDLAVILGQDAHADGHSAFHETSFPQIPTPAGANWTMVHAITRQESQFAQNALSHAGASGLMQLMPGTAREQAGKLGIGYSQSALVTDPVYNIRLGDGYFARMLSYYNGSIPLAVGAYNAGPGNVNKWLRANGDPRTGSVDWIDWIERIPIYETKNYIQKVLENAVIYEHLYPEKVYGRGQFPLSKFLGKNTPG